MTARRTPTCTLYVYDAAGKDVGKDDSPGPEVFGETHAGEGREVQVRHQERRGGQHGGLRGKGRQVMTRRFKRLFGGPDHAGWLTSETATPLAAEAIR